MMQASSQTMGAPSLARSSSLIFIRAAPSLMRSSRFCSSASSLFLTAAAASTWVSALNSASTNSSFLSSTPTIFAAALQPSCSHYWLSRQARSLCVASNTGGMAGTETSNAVEREILVQHLLVKEDQLHLLLDLQRRIIQEGADLSDLVEEYSLCPSKSEGGMLGWVAKGQLVPEFEEAAFSAPLNKLVRVKTKHGWHLVQVLSEREASTLKGIQPEELHILMQDLCFREEAQLIDVREPDEISIAAIGGFKPYPLSQFGQWAPTITEDLEPAKDTYLLVMSPWRAVNAGCDVA
ncbi:hypothetical protein O6H91_04G026700 [Diphasiastrum complanatum]|uniref:Uncharacterized protein n=1 Tax=Diphasiastrum complanatum TaxID=34168 RepID=A0ACC2DVI5_DIPCM|nr:hypothetical protein O6H91_04G026700 [Diphasiastrum complanatum]